MIPIAGGVRVWVAMGHTDMRKGMHGLELQVQRDYRKFRVLGGLEGKKEPYYVTRQSPIDIQ